MYENWALERSALDFREGLLCARKDQFMSKKQFTPY